MVRTVASQVVGSMPPALTWCNPTSAPLTAGMKTSKPLKPDPEGRSRVYRRWMDGRRDGWINESSNSISDSRQATVIKGPVRKWTIIRHEIVLKTHTFALNSVETRCVFISFDKR